MKRNIPFFSIVLSLILLSSVVLTGSMYTIAADNGKAVPYELNAQTTDATSTGGSNILVEDATPPAQSELHQKFSQYLHTDETAVTVFSEEQYADLKAVRDTDSRTPLTYDEILYLINNSISLYFTYDEIRLTNANRDHVTPRLFTQSTNDRVINPEYTDESAYDSYSEAYNAYRQMLTDIYEIIYYRIYMHDAGFEMIHHTYHSGKDNVFGNRYHSDLGMISSAVQMGHYQMLAIDGATFSGIDNAEKLCGEYNTLLEWKRMWEADAIIDYAHYPYLNSAVLCTSIVNTVRQPMEYKFYIVGPKDDPAQQIYPTAELESMMPQPSHEVYFEATNSNGTKPWLSLNYETGRFVMSAEKYQSFAIIGTFQEQDGVLKLYPENADDNGVYSYVFHEQDGNFVYIAADSKPIELAGVDWHTNLVFIREGGSSDPQPPETNGNEVIPEPLYAHPYFKLDLIGNVCSLMSVDGNTYADGSYVQEGDAYILTFEGDYQYVIRYYPLVGYEYDKAYSNPIPEYEFKSGTIFTFDDGVFMVKDDGVFMVKFEDRN